MWRFCSELKEIVCFVIGKVIASLGDIRLALLVGVQMIHEGQTRVIQTRWLGKGLQEKKTAQKGQRLVTVCLVWRASLPHRVDKSSE